MSARVLVVGLDAAEATLLEKWTAAGRLPNIARMMSEGTACKLANCMETLPGAIWPEIWSGRSGGKVAKFYQPEQIHTGEAVLRRVLSDEIDARETYWSAASEAGCRVCVIDQAHAVLDSNLNGIQIVEWGLHDRTFGEDCHPSELKTEIRERYGLHPVRRCDGYPLDVEGRQALLDDLLKGGRVKQQMVLDLMAREPWDLFTCTLSESHCAGHHFWHGVDPSSPFYRDDMPDAHRNALLTVYQKQDETIGKLIAAAGPGCTVLVIASHGIGPSHAGYQLLPEFLARMGMSSDSGAAPGGWLRSLQYKIKNNVPQGLLPLLRALSALGPAKAVQKRLGALRFPLESPNTKAIQVPNNRVGGIRLNLKGREPNGSVAPGNEAKALLDELGTELLALRCPTSGEPIVERVITADEQFGTDHNPDVPDLMIVFRIGRGAIEACRSDRVGLIEIPYFSRRVHRSGDHAVESRLWAMGPGIPSGRELSGANTLDIAPTILQLLDVALADDLDGRPLPLRSA